MIYDGITEVMTIDLIIYLLLLAKPRWFFGGNKCGIQMEHCSLHLSLSFVILEIHFFLSNRPYHIVDIVLVYGTSFPGFESQ